MNTATGVNSVISEKGVVVAPPKEGVPLTTSTSNPQLLHLSNLSCPPQSIVTANSSTELPVKKKSRWDRP